MCKWIRYSRPRNNSTKWQSLFSIWKATSSIEWNWGIFLTECSPWDDTRRFSRGLHLTYIISCCWLTAVSVLLCTNNNNSWVLIVKQDWDYICCQWIQYTAKEFPLEISPWRHFMYYALWAWTFQWLVLSTPILFLSIFPIYLLKKIHCQVINRKVKLRCHEDSEGHQSTHISSHFECLLPYLE